MADKKIQIAIETISTQLKSDLAAISSQFTQLNQVAKSVNENISAIGSGSTSNSLVSTLQALNTQLNQASSASNTLAANLSGGLNQAAIANEKLAQAQIKTAQSLSQYQATEEKLLQTTANRQKSEEQLAQTIAKSAAQQQADASKLEIAQQNILKAVAQRKLAEETLSRTSKGSFQDQEVASKRFLGGIQGISFAFNNLFFSVQNFANLASSTFQQLVGSSIQFENQLIATKATVASANDIQIGGKSLTDPLEKIQKITPALEKAISKVRADSLDLSNITSDQLISSFSSIAGQVGTINASLTDAADLTKAFAAASTTLGIDIGTAQNQTTQILQGSVDTYNTLAKTLNINNSIINQKKSEGKLVEFILDRTKALAAGQKLLSATFSGVTSNIQEVFQRIQEAFGKAVLPPVVEQLNKLQQNLSAIQPQIEAFIGSLGKALVEIGSQIGSTLSNFLPLAQALFNAVGTLAQTALPFLGLALQGVLTSLNGIAAIINVTLVPLLNALSTGAGRFVLTAGLLVLVINGATAAFTALAFRMGFIGPIAQGLIGSFTAFAGVLRAQVASAIATSGSALEAFKALLLSTNAALLAFAAAAAVVAIVAFTAAMDASQKTVDAWSNSVSQTEKQTTKFVTRIKELQTLQKAGTITDADRKKLEGYKKLLGDSAKDIEGQIKDIEAAVGDNKALGFLGLNEDTAKQKIAQLKAIQTEIQNTFDEATLAGKKADPLGSVNDQVKNKIATFGKELEAKTQLSVTQAKEYITTIQQAADLGVITKASAVAELDKIRNSEQLLLDDRLNAQKVLTSIVDTETKKRTALIDASETETQTKISQGLLTEAEGIKQLSDLKVQSKQAEIDGINEKLKFVIAGSDTEKDLITQRKKAVADLAKAQTESIQQQVAALRGGLERELSANDNLRKKAELATQADILTLKLAGYENDRQLDEQNLLIKKQVTESEIADKKRVIEFDKTNLASFVGSQKEREELILKIGNEEADLAKLQLDATDNLIARNKILYEQKIAVLEIEKTSADRVGKLLESQNSLLSAQTKLQEAIADSQVKGAENRLSALKEADDLLKASREKSIAEEQKQRDAQRQIELAGLDDEAKKQKEAQFSEEDAAEAQVKAAKQVEIDKEKERLTRQRLAELGVNAGQSELSIARQIYDQEQKVLELKARRFEQEQANAKRELEVSIQQSQIRDKQLQIEAKIALIRAQESGNKEAIASALELISLTDEQVKNNQQIGSLQRQTLEESQKTERENFNKEQSKAAFDNQIQGANSGLVGLQSSESIKAQEVATPEIAKKSQAAKKLADAKSGDKVQKVLDERKTQLGDVANGAVAFKDTAQEVQDAFASLPNSLSQTKKGLEEVTAQAKELSENPIFKSRDEQAAKAKLAATQTQPQTTQPQTVNPEQPSAKATQQANVENAATKAYNAATNQKNAKITAQNELFGKVDKAIANNNDAGKADQIATLRDQDPTTASDEFYKKVIDNPSGKEARAYAARVNRSKDEQRKATNQPFGLFTGGYLPADTPAIVNERGQEAITNLETLQTNLLPYGERTVQVDAPSWVHNAQETQQIRTLGMLDQVQLPEIPFKAIASTLRINNSALLQEVQKQNKILTQLTEVMRKPNQYNTFHNVPDPNMTVYNLANDMMRLN